MMFRCWVELAPTNPLPGRPWQRTSSLLWLFFFEGVACDPHPANSGYSWLCSKSPCRSGQGPRVVPASEPALAAALSPRSPFSAFRVDLWSGPTLSVSGRRLERRVLGVHLWWKLALVLSPQESWITHTGVWHQPVSKGREEPIQIWPHR